jgi:hypothetical protein
MMINVATRGTGLVGAARVNRDHAAAAPNLVAREAQPGKTPAADAALPLTLALRRPLTDVGQVLDDDARVEGIDDAPTGLAVQVASKPELFIGVSTRTPPRASSVFALKGATGPRVPDLELAPVTPSEEVAGQDDRRGLNPALYRGVKDKLGGLGLGE